VEVRDIDRKMEKITTSAMHKNPHHCVAATG
jgi:hypothetical protein